MERCRVLGGRRRACPGHDTLDGGGKVANSRCTYLPDQACGASFYNRFSRSQVARHPKRDLGLEEVTDTPGISRHISIEIFNHSLLNSDLLSDEVATMPR